jgi:hypothetical protein
MDTIDEQRKLMVKFPDTTQQAADLEGQHPEHDWAE